MTAQQDAVGYIYENVGVVQGQSVKESVGYLYENVGVSDLKVPDGVAYIYEYADSAAARTPTLWMLTPTSGIEGTTIEIWGQGWTGDDHKFFLHAQVGWDGDDEIFAQFEMVEVVPPALIAASGNAYGSLRSIPAADDPNVEHWKAVIQVPADPISGLRKIRIQVTDNP